MNVCPEQVPHREFYRILLSAVAPRPIAWVSTLHDGRLNLAPFSFFNAVSAKPPMLAFCPSLRLVDGHSVPKDTLRNIRETGEFVVNVVTFAVAEAMNLTSGDYDSSVDEFVLANLTTRPSQVVRPPQVAESPVSFECKLNRIIDFGTEAPSGSLVIGEIISIHLEDNVLQGWPSRSRFAGLDWSDGRNAVCPNDGEIRSQTALSGARESFVSRGPFLSPFQGLADRASDSGLAPLRQAQGRLWAAFLRRCGFPGTRRRPN